MKVRSPERSVRRQRAIAMRPSLKSGAGIKVEKSVTIDRSADELYRFWRQFENLSRFLRHVKSVTRSGDGASHWVIETRQGRRLEWDARIIEDKPGEMISWQSLKGADVDNAGSVWFTPATSGRGTVVKLSLKYSPPGGKVGDAIAKLFGDGGEKMIAEDLLRFKGLMETGEVPILEGRPAE